MFHCGTNFIDGIPVEVTRKRIRRINVRVAADGCIHLSVPFWGATLAEGEAFLRSKWRWAMEARTKALKRPAAVRTPVTPEERAALVKTLTELIGAWAFKLLESGVTWTIRPRKSVWGTCHWRKRFIVFNLELARVSRELAEYVVVHELTHLQVADHGPRFQALMDARLPNWRTLRRRLNGRDAKPEERKDET